VGKKQQKSKAIALIFRPFLATFFIFHKWEKNSKKGKAIALTFRPFLATFSVDHCGNDGNFLPYSAIFILFTVHYYFDT
jgi:hypothetical protein